MTYKEAYNKMADQMDKRERFFVLLRSFHAKHGYIPEKWQASWERDKMGDHKSWREQPRVLRRLKRAAKKAARNG